jgi:hypothetical protein
MDFSTGFGQFSFLDAHTVVATAHDGVEIDGQKVQQAIALIEKELTGDYALILNRKEDYSIVPVEVYKYFGSLGRLKAIAIVMYSHREFLPGDMEQRLFKGMLGKFNSIEKAHSWLKEIF